MIPHLNTDFIHAANMEVDVVGTSVEGGRNGWGESQAIDMTGGGMVTLSYSNCFIHEALGHRYINALAGRLNGSVRSVVVPIITDFMGPFAIDEIGRRRAYVTGIPFSDGSLFSDGSGFKQATSWGVVEEAANLGAGTLTMRVYGGNPLYGGEWFSINHSVKNWRAYRTWQIDATEHVEDPDGLDYDLYTVAVSPSLRQAVAPGQRIEFARPRCLMRFPAGFTVSWGVEAPWFSRPTFSFVESFGSI